VLRLDGVLGSKARFKASSAAQPEQNLATEQVVGVVLYRVGKIQVNNGNTVNHALLGIAPPRTLSPVSAK
jgi:hypothetical protein